MILVDKNRYQYLDVLRGGAVLAVLLHHIVGYAYHDFGTGSPMYPYLKVLIEQFIDWGRFGVVLFFLISGFIIPNSLKPGSSLKNFFISRFFRLYPAYWVATALILISVLFFGQADSQISTNQIIANLTMIPKAFGYEELSRVFWTLFIEIIFYGCCAFLFKFNWLNKPNVIGIIAVTLSLITPLTILVNHLFGTHLGSKFILFYLSFLFAGNLIRLSFVDKNKIANNWLIVFSILAIIELFLLTAVFFPVAESINKEFCLFNSYSIISAFVLAFGLFAIVTKTQTLKSAFMAELGQISYSLYLMHMIFLVTLTHVIKPNNTINFFIYLVVGTLICYFSAKLSYRFIEKPAVNIGKKLILDQAYTLKKV